MAPRNVERLTNPMNIGDIATGNYFTIEEDGTIQCIGTTNDTWDDFDFGVANLRINPATSKPDFDQDEAEYLFSANSTETVIGDKVTKHSYKINALAWKPHVHWVQENSGNVLWQLEYKIWPANELEPSWVTLQTIDKEFSYTSGSLHQISSFPDIDMSSYSSIAMHVKVRISRIGGDGSDTYTGDTRFLGFDFHVPVDMFGSREVFVK